MRPSEAVLQHSGSKSTRGAQTVNAKAMKVIDYELNGNEMVGSFIEKMNVEERLRWREGFSKRLNQALITACPRRGMERKGWKEGSCSGLVYQSVLWDCTLFL